MHRPGWLVVLVLGAVVAHHADASAAGSVVVIEPMSLALDFGPINIGTTSAPQRIRVQNTGDTAVTAYLQSEPLYQIVGSGGGLGPGEEAYWDIVVAPTLHDLIEVGPNQFVIAYGPDYYDEIDISLICQVRRAPFDPGEELSFTIGPFTTTTGTTTITNTSGAAKTITGFSSTDPAFTATLHAGTLPVTIPPEASFDLDITFAPTVPNSGYDTEIDAVLDDGSSAYATVATGSTFGIMALEDVRAWGGVPVGATWATHGKLVNYGTTPQTITGITFDHASFAVVGVAAGTVIPPHASIPVAITFSPEEFGYVFTNLTMMFTGADDIMTSFTGFGVTSPVRIMTDDDAPDDGLLEFGEVKLGSSPVTRSVTITNISDQAIGIEHCDVFMDDRFVVTAGCARFLEVGASTHVDLVLQPSQVGRAFALLQFSAYGIAHTIEVRISAQVTLPGFTLSQPSVEFADTVRHPSAPTTADLTIRNTGTAPLDVPTAAIEGDGFFLVAGPPSGVILPTQSVTYTVGFSPDRVAAFAATLVLGPSANPLARIPLHGAGVLRPITAEPELDVGAARVGTSVRASIVLHNAGATAIAISSLTTSDARFRVIAPADLTVPAGGDRAIDVEYRPDAAGAAAATLSIAFDEDPDPQLVIALRGEAATPAAGGCRSDRGAGASPLVVFAIGLLLLRRRRAR